VDATRPNAPGLALTNDTGKSATDFVTKDGALTIDKEAGATLSYVIDGGQPTADYDPTALAEGEHTIEVTQTDLAGNISLTSSITFTIDRTAPDEAVLALASDSGRSTTDGVTNDGWFTLSGVEDGATSELFVDGVATASYDADALADGEHTLNVIVTDAAGNASTTSLTFTLDRVALAPVLTLTSDTGGSSTDKITNSNGALTVTGVEDGATLSYVVDGGAASSYYDPDTLADGEHTVELVQTDLAGNVSSIGSITFTLDRSTPDAMVLALASDSGTSATDNLTNDGALAISGQEDGTTLSYVVDGGAASSSFNPDALADGEHTVEVTQTDAAGNVSDTASITFTLDRTAAAPGLTLTSDTGSSSTDKITSSGALTITRESGATLSYIVDGGPASSTYNPSALADGAHTVMVTQIDKAGNISSAGILSFTLDKMAPTVTGVTASGPGVSGGSGTLTTGQTAEFKLTLSEAVTLTNATNLTLTLSNGEQAIYDAAASSGRTLVFDYKVGLEDTSSDLAVTKLNLNGATIKDAAGNVLNITGVSINPAGTLIIDGYTGTSAADSFTGTAGAETFRGLGGNDTYVVNNSGDVVVEGSGAGTDLVKSSISYTLSANVENLTLTGSAKINAAGNALANILTGNSADNVLNGKAGADRMAGGAGNDIYVVDDIADVVVEGANAGTDFVKSSISHTLSANVENLILIGAAKTNAAGNTLANSLTGSSADNVLSGKAGNDLLAGGAGADTLYGGAGADRLTGGSGADLFLFKAASETTVTSSGRDTITDFSRSQGDKIYLKAIDANTGLNNDQAFTFIDTQKFHNKAGELRYEIKNGATFIYGDVDGDGGADFSIALDLSLAIKAADFIL
jgi:Ca2+-binding RTX toxin-like protein